MRRILNLVAITLSISPILADAAQAPKITCESALIELRASTKRRKHRSEALPSRFAADLAAAIDLAAHILGPDNRPESFNLSVSAVQGGSALPLSSSIDGQIILNPMAFSHPERGRKPAFVYAYGLVVMDQYLRLCSTDYGLAHDPEADSSTRALRPVATALRDAFARIFINLVYDDPEMMARSVTVPHNDGAWALDDFSRMVNNLTLRDRTLSKPMAVRVTMEVLARFWRTQVDVNRGRFRSTHASDEFFDATAASLTLMRDFKATELSAKRTSSKAGRSNQAVAPPFSGG